MTRRLILIPTLAVAIGACARPDAAGTALELQRDTVGDTIVVRTIGGSLWRGAARLEEELSIGARDGAEEYTFGHVVEVTPDGAWGVYVFDQQVPALRHYDQRGRFIKTLGGEGEGPGEYQAAVVGMALRRDGRLMAHDAQNRRINLYEPDGTPSEHWRVNSGLFPDRSLLVDSLDHTYVKILTVAHRVGETWPWPIGLLHLDERGQVVDSIRPPAIDGESTSSRGELSPVKVWALHPYVTVVGVNATYTFEIRRPNGKVIRVTRQHQPLALSDDEWQAYETRRLWEIRDEKPVEPPPVTPRIKPAYRSFTIAEDGRIWVRKYMPVVPRKVEPSTDPGEPPPFPFSEQVGFDVFDAEGVYLGEIIVPARTDLDWIGSDHMYGIRRGELDEQYVVRLRLRIPSR